MWNKSIQITRVHNFHILLSNPPQHCPFWGQNRDNIFPNSSDVKIKYNESMSRMHHRQFEIIYHDITSAAKNKSGTTKKTGFFIEKELQVLFNGRFTPTNAMVYRLHDCILAASVLFRHPMWINVLLYNEHCSDNIITASYLIILFVPLINHANKTQNSQVSYSIL